MFKLPDALIIGPMRTGTTWVYEYLKARGDVCLPLGVKETFFFDQRFGKGLNWYRAHFRHFDPQKHKRVVEVAPSYFHNEEAPKRIREMLGTPCLITIIRDPVERSISHYRHLRRRGLVTESIVRAVDRFPEIIDASRYSKHLARWEATFGRGAIFVLWYQDLRDVPDTFVRTLCKILSLPMYPVPIGLLHKKVNSAGDPPSFCLARVGKRVGDWFRERRLYAPLELAKALGVKRFLFGTGHDAEKIEITLKERLFLQTQLADEWQEFQTRLCRGESFSWRSSFTS